MSWPVSEVSIFAWSIVVAASIVALGFDLRWRRIPNALTGALFLSGLAYGLIHGGLGAMGSGLAGSIVIAAPFIVLWQIAGGGAADAKLMGGIGAWLGLTTGTFVLVCVMGSGIAMGILWGVRSGRIREIFWNVVAMANSFMLLATGRQDAAQFAATMPHHRNMLKMPYGLAICMGLVIAALGAHQWHS